MTEGGNKEGRQSSKVQEELKGKREGEGESGSYRESRDECHLGPVPHVR
jgi:hypothetical protein